MKQKDILIIFILLFIFVVAWVGSNIYHSIVRTTISETVSQDISPITPTFDIKTVNKLRERQKINPSFELESLIESSQNSSDEGTLRYEKSIIE